MIRTWAKMHTEPLNNAMKTLRRHRFASRLAVGVCATLCTMMSATAFAQSAPTCDLRADPPTVPYGGDSTLVWTSQGATSAQFDRGLGSVPVSGTKSLAYFISTISYKLTVTGQGGTSTCSATVRVGERSNASCDVSVTPTTIKKGQKATLKWSSTNATEASFIGVADVEPTGSHDVYPEESTDFVLTVFDAHDRIATCKTHVDVDDGASAPIAVASDVAQRLNGQTPATPNTGYPPAQGNPQVTLSNIPYTGFDVGPLGELMYWLSLSLFAASGAYLILYYKGGAAVFYADVRRQLVRQFYG